MIVHYLSSSTLPSRAANSVHVMKMAAAITRIGHDVTLFAGAGAEPGDLAALYGVGPEVDVELVDVAAVPVLGSWIRAVRYRRRSRARGRPDLYWGRHVQSVLAVSRSGVPVILESHAPAASAYHRLIESRVLRSRSFHRLVVVSEALADEYRRRYPDLPPDRLVVAHDAADPIPPDTEPIPDLPGRAGAVRVGYTGHLYDGRGIELIVQVARNCPDLDVHLVGGTDADVERWRDRIATAGHDNVHLHGFRPSADIPRYLRSFDILLAPYERRVAVAGGTGDTSRWMSPLKLFEYMASGRAIVCSRLPVLGEIIADGRNGIMSDPGDVGDWTHAVRRLADDPALRARLGATAEREFLARHTWEQRARRVLADAAG